jgi:hypothetical protein
MGVSGGAEDVSEARRAELSRSRCFRGADGVGRARVFRDFVVLSRGVGSVICDLMPRR